MRQKCLDASGSLQMTCHPYYLLLALGQALYLFLVHHSQLCLHSQTPLRHRPACGEQLAPREAHGSQGEDNISEWQTTGRSPKCTFVHPVSHQFHQLSMLAGRSLSFTKNRRALWCFLLHRLEQELEMAVFLASRTHCCLPSLANTVAALFAHSNAERVTTWRG